MNIHAASLASLVIVSASAAAAAFPDDLAVDLQDGGWRERLRTQAIERELRGAADDPAGSRAAWTPSDDPCAGDVTGNGNVNPVDLAALLVDWGTDGNGEFDTDCNDDGIVDADDLAIVLADWGPCS